MTSEQLAQITAHYQRSDHYEAIIQWLRQQGKDTRHITVDDLAPADHYHGGQIASTKNLAELADVHAGQRVADLGGGIGGPARWLAVHRGCKVDVVDLTPEFCSIGAKLSDLVGLGEKVRFFCASATSTGLDTGVYDLVWMQNASMNIRDRTSLYTEVGRLLKPGGRFVFQEAELGDNGVPYFPTGWASRPEDSFLLSPEATLRSLLETGFRILSWVDETDAMLAMRQQELSQRAAGIAPPNYLSVEKLRDAAAKARQSLDEGRARYGRGLFQKL